MNLSVQNSEGYELLDSGEERKLERFGRFILDRPSPQAIWPKSTPGLWKKAHAAFARHETGQGDWTATGMPLKDPWKIPFQGFSFEMRLTGFGNVGLFPEHSVHWSWLEEQLKNTPKNEPPTVLNLFGYTGGASLLCARAGARVVHVDAAKAVNAWAIANAEHNRLEKGAVRCLSEDALKFVSRELRKGKRFDGIILDPPTFGRGASGEVWKIERDFHPLLTLCRQLLSDRPRFLLASAHSPGITPVSLENLLSMKGGSVDSGEMLLHSAQCPLPSGVFVRWRP